jgi:hypothetical protein
MPTAKAWSLAAAILRLLNTGLPEHGVNVGVIDAIAG